MEENNEFKNPENVENSNNVASNNNQLQKSPKAKKIIAGVACVVVVAGVITGVALNREKIFNKTDNNNDNSTISQSTNNSTEQNNTTDTKTTQKIDESRPWVYDADYGYNKPAKTITNNLGTVYNSTDELIVPYINVNSEYAKSVNEELKILFEKEYNAFGGAYPDLQISEGYLPKIQYQFSAYNDILSLYVQKFTSIINGDGSVKYYTYNINLKTLEKASLADVYTAAGFSSEDYFKESVENTVANEIAEGNLVEEDVKLDYKLFFLDKNKVFNLVLTSPSGNPGAYRIVPGTEKKTSTSNQTTSTQNVDKKTTYAASIQNINIDDYIGTWYTSKENYGYDDVTITKDEKNNINVKFGIYRLSSFDKLNASLSGDTITFTGYDYDADVSGTIKLEKNRIVLNYKTPLSSSQVNQELIFNYLIDNKTTEKYERDNPVGTIEIIDKDDSSFIYNLSVTNATRGQEYPNGNVNIGGVTGVAVKNGDNTYVDEINSGYASKIYWLKFSFKDDNTVVVTEEEGFSTDSGFFGAGVYATGTFKK